MENQGMVMKIMGVTGLEQKITNSEKQNTYEKHHKQRAAKSAAS